MSAPVRGYAPSTGGEGEHPPGGVAVKRGRGEGAGQAAAAATRWRLGREVGMG